MITDAGTGTFGAGNTPGVFNQLVSFKTPAQFTSVISAECTNTGTGNGPYYDVYRNKAGGAAANDGIGGFLWYGNNSAATKTNIAYITSTILTPTAGAEAGQINFARMVAGALTVALTIGSTVQISTALGVTGGISSSGSILSTSALGIGYATGAGGAVTQGTSKSTGVTLNKPSGQITMNAAALAAGTIVSFVLTNTSIAATDVLILNHISGGTPGSYSLNARCAAGSATIDVRNNTAGSLSEAIVIGFALVKGVTA